MNRHAVQTALFMAMEASWIGALALFVDATRGSTNDLSVLLVLTFYPLGPAVKALVERARLAGWRRRAAFTLSFAAAVVFAVLLVFPMGERPWHGAGLGWFTGDDRGFRIVAFAAIGLFCFLRGGALQGRAVSAEAIRVGLQIGLVMLVIVLALSQGLSIEWPGAPVVVVVFILSGLLAMWHHRAGARPDGVSARNPAAAIFGILLVLGLSAGLVMLFDRAILDQLMGVLRRIAEAIGAMLTFLLDLVPGGRPDPALLEQPSELDVDVMPDDPNPFLLPQDWRPIFAASLFSAFGIGIAAILFTNLRLLVSWLRKPRGATPGLELGRSRHGLADTLRAFRSWLGRLFAGLAVRLGLRPREHKQVDPVRLAYLQAEDWLTRKGWPRNSSETPLEYAARMRPEWPDDSADLALLTDRYIATRYGYAKTQDADPLQQMLARIRRTIRKMRTPITDAPDAGRHVD